MFENIEISNFRGIREGYIEGFKRVNLFLGNNNCGKSTLLEALYLLTEVENPLLLVNVNGLRGFTAAEKDELHYLFYGVDRDKIIKVSTQGQEVRDLEVSLTEGEMKFDVSNNNAQSTLLQGSLGIRYGLKQSYTINNGKGNVSQLIFNKEPDGKISAENLISNNASVDTIVGRLLNTANCFNPNIDDISRITINKREDSLLELFRIIDPRVSSIALSGDNKLYLDIGMQKRIPINFMGDGVRKLYAIAVSMCGMKVNNADKGILLIDEIDNGLHHSVMNELWNKIFRLSELMNVQIFATTHSKDALIGFRNALLNNNKKDGIAIKLRNQDGLLEGFAYGVEQLDLALEQDFEVR